MGGDGLGTALGRRAKGGRSASGGAKREMEGVAGLGEGAAAGEGEGEGVGRAGRVADGAARGGEGRDCARGTDEGGGAKAPCAIDGEAASLLPMPTLVCSAATLSGGTTALRSCARAAAERALAATRADTTSAGAKPLAEPDCATVAASRKKSSKLMRSFGWRLRRRRMMALTSPETLVGTFCSCGGSVSSTRFSSGNLMRSSPRSMRRSKST